ncbi:MAG: phytanoyl-CoA dioxygenase family protein [Armatimonadetes bacterium]|nr:phytanoyl-CoA dioxygenase family protein [Armatimonadota bacterium]
MDVKGFFDEHGFYVAKAVYSHAETAELEAEFDRIVAQILGTDEDVNARWSGPEMDRMGAAGTVVLHTHNVQQYSGAWLRAFLNPAFLDAAEAIVGPDIVLHHSKLFQKPAELGAPFPMHQDWGYFPTLADTMTAGIVHVSEATDEMGCLRVYPGTHRLGRRDEAMGGGHALIEEFPIERATPLEASPGDVVFFHYCLIHGSLPNRSNKVRKTVLAQIHAGTDEVEAGNLHPDERLCLRGFNSTMTRSKANRLKA